MKNLAVSILFILACSMLCLAQEKKKNYFIEKYGYDDYRVETLNSKHRIMLTVDSSTNVLEPFNYIGNQPLTNLVYLEGSKEIKLTTYIHKDSISFYRYSITENDQHKLITNAIPDNVEHIFNHRATWAGYAVIDLGSYNMQNKKLKIELYKVSEIDKVSSVIIYNKPIQPAQLVFTSLLTKPNEFGRTVLISNLKDKAAFKMTDDVGGIAISIRNTDLNFIYHVFLKHIASGNTVQLSNNWIQDTGPNSDPFIHINVSSFQQKGDYELSVMPVLSQSPTAKRFPQKSTILRFNVQKETTFTKKEIALLLAGIFLVFGVLITFIRARSNKKVAQEKQEKEISQLQLNLVRSQLNPHFMFNAMASIQNLMNKNDTDNANRYLGKFARLTRSVLKNQEFISLKEEISLLEDYLQMEKLRFGFHYTIAVDDALVVANIEIPAMLLQPFVENAVKHGISGLQDKGEISIRFDKTDADLHLLIIDNGGGFDLNASYTGLGLELSRRRIALLNNIYKNAPILLQIKTDESGTEVKISLLHWL